MDGLALQFSGDGEYKIGEMFPTFSLLKMSASSKKKTTEILVLEVGGERKLRVVCPLFSQTTKKNEILRLRLRSIFV